MKAEELKELIDGITRTGYEITAIKPEYFVLESEGRKHLTGAYTVTIAPARERQVPGAGF